MVEDLIKSVPSRPLRPDEVKDLLGVSVRTVRRYVASGLLTRVQVARGKALRIDRASVCAIMEARED